jgi:hypothetical protein
MPANYAELFTDVVELIGKPRYSSRVPRWVGYAEKEAVRRIRELREVIYQITGTMTDASDSLTMPAGITGIEGLQINTDPIRMLKQVSLSELQDHRARQSVSSSSYPTVFTWVGAETIEMHPTPGDAHAYTLYYKGAMTEADHEKVTSQTLEQAPDWLLYKAAYHGFMYARNFASANEYKAEAEAQLLAYAQLLARGDLQTPQVQPFSHVHDHPSRAN